jgi:hypothetical protein
VDRRRHCLPLKGKNERRLRAVGCETIYAFIYRAAQKAEQLWRYLTRRHKRRRPRRSRPSRDTIKARVSNLTPRKCLGFTPFQAILKELGKDVQIRFS